MSSNNGEWIQCNLVPRCSPVGPTLGNDNNNNNDLPFNYVPSFAAGIVFVVLFSIVTGTFSYLLPHDGYLTHRSTATHLGQALRGRAWWLFPTVITGGVGEIIGWAGRLWGSQNPTSRNPFLMQYVPRVQG